ncbi:MAG: T9SS type A sorting domain-containing protein [Candidatus Kapabacteria bacterium]|nr:T9SS type A sorting domain-containing protein [Ignavibacteriota bacterium]MCW5884309.1 T9SS type A sorting domain-containing protein [Candidatus Kapabacteria bacterium]
MKKFLITAVGIAILIAVSVSPSLFSQVNGEYRSITLVENTPYENLVDPIVIPHAQFALGPNYITTDRNDGYHRVNLGFDFEMNGEVFNQCWIGVNGFITLSPPPFLPAKNVNALFLDANNYPVNVIAPFWGDHYLRNETDFFTEGFVISEISYKLEEIEHEDGRFQKVFVVQWKDLNINYMLNNEPVKSSVANFQLRLYESLDAFSYQGNIEFAYGTVGPRNRPDMTDTRVITTGSTIGIKGEGKIVGEGADYLNGLLYNQDITLAATSQAKTSNWQPSGGSDKRILFTASSVFNVAEWWGDGDVDFSKARGNKHFGMTQSRFVTVNDVRLIMNSVATGIPLDPVRRRQAYHGDVNHNGRYYFATDGTKIPIKKKSKVFTDDLPNEVSSVKQILFEANEHDASFILAYMAGRVPELPWLLDTAVQWGKVISNDIASNLKIGTIAPLGNNEYQIPVYLNGDLNGPMSAKFEINGRIIDVVKNENEATQMLVISNENRVVVSGQGDFESNNPILIIKVSTDASNIVFSGVRFNDKEVGDLNVVASVENNDALFAAVSVTPNVITDKAFMNVNISVDGYYELNVYDLQGNVVSRIMSGDVKSGSYLLNWDAKDMSGSSVSNGMYIYRLNGAGLNESGKIIVNR